MEEGILNERDAFVMGDGRSRYERHSGDLPKTYSGVTDAHKRDMLPSPRTSEGSSLFDWLRRNIGN